MKKQMKLKEQEQEILKYCIKNNLIKENGFIQDHINNLNLKPKNNLLSGKRKSWNDVRDSLITPDFVPFRRYYVNNISANGGVGKSFLTLQTSILHILNEKYEYDRNVNVLFWSSEDMFEDIADRFYMICNDVLKLSKNDIDFINERLTILDGDSEIFSFIEGEKNFKKISNNFKTFKNACSNFDLIILDPLLAFYSNSELDENNNSEAKMFMFLLTNWCFETKKTIIVVSHSAKGSVNVRGAQSFLDAFRFSISLHKFEEPLVDSNGDVVKDLRTNEIIYQEMPDKSHMREVRILKDNSNISEFIKINKEQFNLSYTNNFKIFEIQVFPVHKIQEEINYKIPEKRFVSPRRIEDIQSRLEITSVYN